YQGPIPHQSFKNGHTIQRAFFRLFLGLAGHFGAFIKDYALKTECLNTLMQKDVEFESTDECESAFRSLVQIISSDPVVCIPDSILPFEFNRDALIRKEELSYTSGTSQSKVIAKC
ncbi:hypothetical protein IscW_ISCW015331, partial [Ixodes scapularis]